MMDFENYSKAASYTLKWLEARPERKSVRSVYLKAGTPDWAYDLAHAVHDNANIAPDDYRYLFLEQSLDAIVDNDGDIEAAEEQLQDVYQSRYDLGQWFAESHDGWNRTEDAIKELGTHDLEAAMSFAQAGERLEVFHIVVSFLAERFDEITDAA